MADVLIQTPIDVYKATFNVKESEIFEDCSPILKQPNHIAHNDPDGITSEAGSLRGIDLSATHLISSPYPDRANQLNLDELDIQCRLFALALTTMKPTRTDYATAPYMESFGWSELFAVLRSLSNQAGITWREQSFYVVIFRSKLLPDIDRDRLGLLDQKSHEEACASGGLLKYWFGSPDAERRNLATCLWRDRQDAFDGGRGPWHKLARAAAREMYEHIEFHVHRLTVTDGAKAWELSQYQ